MTAPPDFRSPAERVADTERILFEMAQAVREALAEHRRAGNSIAVWRDGRVALVPATQIPEDISASVPES